MYEWRTTTQLKPRLSSCRSGYEGHKLRNPHLQIPNTAMHSAHSEHTVTYIYHLYCLESLRYRRQRPLTLRVFFSVRDYCGQFYKQCTATTTDSPDIFTVQFLIEMQVRCHILYTYWLPSGLVSCFIYITNKTPSSSSSRYRVHICTPAHLCATDIKTEHTDVQIVSFDDTKSCKHFHFSLMPVCL